MVFRPTDADGGPSNPPVTSSLLVRTIEIPLVPVGLPGYCLFSVGGLTAGASCNGREVINPIFGSHLLEKSAFDSGNQRAGHEHGAEYVGLIDMSILLMPKQLG